MNPRLNSSFLRESIRLLVKHFGENSVRSAVAELSGSAVPTVPRETLTVIGKPKRNANPPITAALEKLRHTDQEKYRLLITFYSQLREKGVLPESQDISQFAQLIGLKEIRGKSRKDLLPKLMRFLLEQPTERLRSDLNKAIGISEQQRKEGFSVLTD